MVFKVYETDWALLFLSWFGVRFLGELRDGNSVQLLLGHTIISTLLPLSIIIDNNSNESRIKHPPSVHSDEIDVISQEIVERIEGLVVGSVPHHWVQWILAEHEEWAEVVAEVAFWHVRIERLERIGNFH